MRDHGQVERRCREALKGLAANTRKVHGYDEPVLIEGGDYVGIWLECGPLEGLVYCRYAPDVAKECHRIFFALQREDGYIPCWVHAKEVGSAQIQMVVPIAATALETADLTGDERLLDEAYRACVRWDAWLRRHRDTRGTGLCEAFCEWDTGHDNSPRFHGAPKACPNKDAAVCPESDVLPYLAPDLSASVYGGRVALAGMAERLGKPTEAQEWRERAEEIRLRIIATCFDPEDECFYDVDRQGRFVKVRGDALTRVLGEHVVDQAMFERIWARHIHNPDAFWTPFPLPSIAADDPSFVRDMPFNSWGGASQALTALRTPRWFLHYGKEPDLRVLMERWVDAIVDAPDFLQQMNPWTGAMSTSPGYSPAMLVLLDFAERLGAISPSAAGSR
jgi:hypothetical protein